MRRYLWIMHLCLCWFESKKSSPTAFFAKTHYILFLRNFSFENLDQFRKISSAPALNHLQLGFSENLAVTGFSFWPQTSNCAGSILRKFIEHASPIRQHQPCFPADKIQKDALNFFWEISCSDPFAQLVVQKVQILVRQPLLTLSYNRSVLDIFKFFILQHLGLSPVFIPRSHFSM